MRKRRILISLAVLLLLSGCGRKESENVPELKEPAAVNNSFRQVQYGDIGTTDVLLGTAVPEEYGQAYSANVSVTRILVQPGDMVEKGDVLAYSDVAEAKDSLEAKKQELSHENTVYALNENISSLQQEKLQSAQEDDGTQIAILQENSRYDGKLHEYRVQKLEQEIADLEAVIAEGTLVADHSGEVVYIKSLLADRKASAGENVVIVADFGDMAIKLNDATIQNYKYAESTEKYMLVDGEKVPVTERDYSTEELVLAKINHYDPPVIIEQPEGVELEAGELYPVYYQNLQAQNVLLVGNDSLYQEGQETYVYVKNADDTREKRKVTVGAADSYNTQIKDGLVEGEEVCYETTERMPADYTEYTVARSDFQIANHGLKYGRADIGASSYLAQKEGGITKIAVEKDAEVKKGDLLYVIDTGEGKAAITEAANAIEKENSAYQEQQADYDAQLNELENGEDAALQYDQQIITLQKAVAQADHENRMQQLQKTYDTLTAQNDGTGKLSVYAASDGTVSKVIAKEGDTVEAGDEILKMKGTVSDLLQVEMVSSRSVTVYTENIADVGEKVSITSGDHTYTGTCVGFAAGSNNLDERYLFTDDAGTHLTFNTTSGYEAPAFYVQMEDEIVDDMANGGSVDFDYISMKDVVVLPAGMIYEEKDAMNPKKISYFVWKVEDDHLVKQYVTLDDRLSGNGKVVLSGVEPQDVLARE